MDAAREGETAKGTYVQVSTDKDDLALEIGLGEVTNRLLGHSGNYTGSSALQKNS